MIEGYSDARIFFCRRHGCYIGMSLNPLNEYRSPMNSKLKRLSLAVIMSISAIGAASPASAAFVYRHYVLGMTASPSNASQDAAANLVVSLLGVTLPEGLVNSPYGYDLNQLLTVTGDSALSTTDVSWSLSSGALPQGLILGANGVVSGTPTTQTMGSSFKVLATYKTKSGQQAYSIVVHGQNLEVTKITAGTSHTCAVTTTGGVKCWGFNRFGELGNNSTLDSATPVDVVGLSAGVVGLSAGSDHTCALTSAGAVTCWGYNYFGQLGNNTTTHSSVPVGVYGLTSGVATISAGNSHVCAVTSSGGAKCWGYNAYGQLGNNSAINGLIPGDVQGLISGVASVEAGGYSTCAVTISGGAKCWGVNWYGQLGTNSTTDSLVPTDVMGLTSGVTRVSVGELNACAVTVAGGLKCWGDNSSGQLGTNTTNNSLVPTDVLGLASGVASVELGTVHMCAVTVAGGLKCWGDNSSGQLGTNTTANSFVPADVLGLTSGVVSVSAGDAHTCAVTTGGARCWGLNRKGQLGNNSTVDSLSPVGVLK